jgi:hypothetical protein
MQIFKPHPGPTESEFLQPGSKVCVLISSSGEKAKNNNNKKNPKLYLTGRGKV